MEFAQLSTGLEIEIVLLGGGILSGVTGTIALLVKIIVVLVGIAIALVISRIVSNIPRFLEILPQLILHRITWFMLWCGRSLIKFVLNRVSRTLQYFFDTDEARRFCYRIRIRIEAIKSIFQTKS